MTRHVFGSIEIRTAERRVWVGGQQALLGARAFDLLLALVERRERVVCKDELLAIAWPGMVVEESNLSVQIATLRKALGTGSITTVPGVGYRFTPTESAIPEALPTLGDGQRVHPAAEPPSLAVLPFANLSGDPAQDYFVDGVVDDLTDALSRVRRFFVIARSSSFTFKGRAVDVPTVGRELGVRYVVEGSFRQMGERIRIGVQLVETAAGRQLWSQRFEGRREEIFELQDRIVDQVVAAVEPSLVRAELERGRQRPTESLAAYELCLRALPAVMLSNDPTSIGQALSLLRRAIALDPGYTLAKALLAWAHGMAWSNRWMSHRDAMAALPLAQEAQAEHRDNPVTLAHAGHAISMISRRHEQSLRALDLALQLNPNSVMVQYCAGWVRTYVGDADLAVGHFERAQLLNPIDPDIGYALAGLAFAHLVGGRDDAALAAARRAMLEIPAFVPAKLALVHALVRTGRLEDARPLVVELMQKMPRLTISRYAATQLFQHDGYVQRCSEDLRALGGPE